MLVGRGYPRGVSPALARPAERRERFRGEERRESPRFAWPIGVVTERRSAVYLAHVSLGGVRFFAKNCFVSDQLVVRIRLPEGVIHLRGRVSSMERSGEDGFAVRVLFKDPPVLDELLLARWLQAKTSV